MAKQLYRNDPYAMLQFALHTMAMSEMTGEIKKEMRKRDD